MAVDQKIKDRVKKLIGEVSGLADGSDSDCTGWLTQPQAIVEMVCPLTNAYRTQIKFIVLMGSATGGGGQHGVEKAAAVLSRLLEDIEDGLIASIVDQAAAETFDNFLDHAEAYLRENRKDPAGVVAGVVFEDTIRRIYRKNSTSDAGKKLDDLISALAKSQVITATKAKRARTGAHVRTKATHAQWDEFDAEDVKETVRLTRQLLDDHLD